MSTRTAPTTIDLPAEDGPQQVLHWSGYPLALIDMLPADDRAELEMLGEIDGANWSEDCNAEVRSIIDRTAYIGRVEFDCGS